MITYNPKDWFTFIFRIHRSETFAQAGYFAHAPYQPIAIYGQLLVYIQGQASAASG